MATYHVGTDSSRLFNWCGFEWFCKDSFRERVGPGPSLFDAKNIEKGEDNSLRLWVRNNGTVPYHKTKTSFASAEITTTAPLGYGMYQLDVYGPLTDSRWDNVVLGFFTYNFEDGSENNEEIDIEIGRFNGRHDSGGVFSNFNNVAESQQLMNISPSNLSQTHQLLLEWRPGFARWILKDLDANVVLNDLTSTESIPTFKGAKLHINFWQFKDVVPDGKEQFIVLQNFKHTEVDKLSPN